jgi:tetrahydromethanopterin S-methyltransferase subunit G
VSLKENAQTFVMSASELNELKRQLEELEFP